MAQTQLLDEERVRSASVPSNEAVPDRDTKLCIVHELNLARGSLKALENLWC